MIYTNAYKAVQEIQRTAAGTGIRAKRKSQYERIKVAIRTAAGWTTSIMFMLVLCKAGASDCGAPLEEIFPSTFICIVIAMISFFIWECCGGNQPYNNQYKQN